MATQIYRYTLHRVGIRKPLVKGEIRKKTLELAIKALQRKIKKTVCKQHIQVMMKVWNPDVTAEKFSKQYDNKRDFKSLKQPAKWRKALSRKVKYSRSFDPEPKFWFVAVGKKRQVSLVRLAEEPAKRTLLARKRKKLIGPFETEAAAQELIAKIERGQFELQRKTDVKQHRRYKGV